MKPEAQQIAIAEACGWKQVIEELFNIQQMSWIRPGDKENHGFRPPDYLNDLNAMNEAEDAVIRTDDCSSDGPSNRYYHILDSLSLEPICYATAAQREEAFLKCLGLWKDDACPQRQTRELPQPLIKNLV